MKIQRTNFDGDWDDTCPYCGEKQEKHKEILAEYQGARYEHRMPCDPEKREIIRQARARARTVKSFLFLGWILVPLIITITGFASVWVGVSLFVLALFKIAWTGVELFGKPEEWWPGYKGKVEKECKMRHYFYHCEKNPDGFRTILIENLKSEEGAEEPT